MLKYFYITNRPEVASIADKAGVDRIFVDLEKIGKEKRQPMDTVKNYHTLEDIYAVRRAVKNAELLVRINPLYENSEYEVEESIKAGANIIMLPMWNSADDVKIFSSLINGRAKVLPLLETDEAANSIDEVLKLNCVDEVHIGLNDLSISQNKPFLFQLLTDGTVEALAQKLNAANLPFGIGGVGSVTVNVPLSAKNILAEHYRLGSQMVILSRSFCNADEFSDINEFEAEFNNRLNSNREYEKQLMNSDSAFLNKMHNITTQIISEIVK